VKTKQDGVNMLNYNGLMINFENSE